MKKNELKKEHLTQKSMIEQKLSIVNCPLLIKIS